MTPTKYFFAIYIAMLSFKFATGFQGCFIQFFRMKEKARTDGRKGLTGDFMNIGFRKIVHHKENIDALWDRPVNDPDMKGLPGMKGYYGKPVTYYLPIYAL